MELSAVFVRVRVPGVGRQSRNLVNYRHVFLRDVADDRAKVSWKYEVVEWWVRDEQVRVGAVFVGYDLSLCHGGGSD